MAAKNVVLFGIVLPFGSHYLENGSSESFLEIDNPQSVSNALSTNV